MRRAVCSGRIADTYSRSWRVPKPNLLNRGGAVGTLTFDRQVLVDEYWAQRQRSLFGLQLQMGLVIVALVGGSGFSAYVAWSTQGLGVLFIGAVALALSFGLLLIPLAQAVATSDAAAKTPSVVLPSGETVRVSQACIAQTARDLASMSSG